MKSKTRILAIAAFLCSLLIMNCRNSPDLTLLSAERQFDLALQNKLVYSGEEIYTTTGKKISRDALSEIARLHGRKYCVDYYTDREGVIRKIVLRESTAADSLLYDKINLKLNERPSLNLVEVNCNTVDSVLEHVMNADQKVRQAGDYTNMDSVDRANQTAVVSIIEHCGFPTAKEVGSDGILAMWLTIQHSSLEHMLAYEEQFDQAVARGELSLRTHVLMKDRILLDQGLPQKYGTQVVNNELWKVDNMDSVRVRRKRVGLGPLEEYLAGMGVAMPKD